ncbi:hypothetical protein ACSLO6_30410, partial [Escherichia coli]
HLVSEISNGVGQSQAYDAIYQARRIRLARKFLNGKKPEEGLIQEREHALSLERERQLEIQERTLDGPSLGW